jgi:hypothetical protein
MVFNATFNNISVISWWSVLLVEETGVREFKAKNLADQVNNNVVRSSLLLQHSPPYNKGVVVVIIWFLIVCGILEWKQICAGFLLCV